MARRGDVYKKFHSTETALLHVQLDVLRANKPKGMCNFNSKQSMRSNGDIKFRVFAPFLWNQLPLHMHKYDDLSAFKTYLKTHRYKIAYD